MPHSILIVSFVSLSLFQDARAKSSLITRTVNLANISTPINNDLLLIQDKRFKHLAHSFIDPRSPSEGIVRTPIVIKSSDISSIVNTPRILEEELEDEREGDEEEEDFQKTFEERLSRLSFDALDHGDEEEARERLPDLMETHFDCQEEAPVTVEPLKPMTLVTNLITQSAIDPRSPTIGIDRTPLVFGAENKQHIPRIINNNNVPTFAEILKAAEQEEEEEEKKDDAEEKGEEENKEAKETIEGAVEEKQAPTIVEPEQSNVFVDVGRVIYGTPLSSATGPIQQVRTPLSCLANRKRREFNAAAGKSPLSSNKKKSQQAVGGKDCGELKVKKSSTNPYESNTTTPRKMIR